MAASGKQSHWLNSHLQGATRMEISLTENVLITGANKGIGFETARLMGEAGYRVWLGARDQERGGVAAKNLTDRGLDVRFVDIAVDDEARVLAAAERVTAEDGKLDVLINNAGIPGTYADPLTEGVDDIRRVYEVNVFGPTRVIKAFLPLLKAAGKADVVNLSSGLGSFAWMTDPTNGFYGVNLLGYNSSKSALNAITVSLAKAVEQFGIRVNVANPGYVKTDFTNNNGYRTAEEAAEIIVKIAKNEDSVTGKFLGDSGLLPW
jgi:NAD(P)-dependent dehydrogenase (short-subunit alcohol dehydrogenase family)